MNPLKAKRVAPAHIEPIETNQGTIDHKLERTQDGFEAFICLKDTSGNLKWKTSIFHGHFDKHMETDVQEIYLKKMTLENNRIIAVDERNKSYELEMAQGKLIKPERPVEY